MFYIQESDVCSNETTNSLDFFFFEFWLTWLMPHTITSSINHVIHKKWKISTAWSQPDLWLTHTIQIFSCFVRSRPSSLFSLFSFLFFLVCVESDMCNMSLRAGLLVVVLGLMVHLTAFSGLESRPAPGEAPLRVTYYPIRLDGLVYLSWPPLPFARLNPALLRALPASH